MRADNGEYGYGEGDVGRCGNGPAADRFRVAPVEPNEDEGWNDNAANGRRDGYDRLAELAQVAGDELLLQFQPDEEEEDGEQPVGCPLSEAQVQMPRLIADPEVPKREVAVGCRRVRPDDRDHRGQYQQRTADRLLPEDRADAHCFGIGAPAKETGSALGIAHRVSFWVDEMSADQTSRLTESQSTGRLFCPRCCRVSTLWTALGITTPV
jgi:hypothetical protein